MYNGIGLQTPRGSGTNGYAQTNKFFVRPRSTGVKLVGKGFEDDQGTAGLSKKPNKAILEHDRKRQIHLKLAILENKLADQCCSNAEIAHKLDEAMVKLEAVAASEETVKPISCCKENIAFGGALEAFRAALGLPDQQQVAEEGIIDDEPAAEAYEGRLKERREHSFLDRDSGRKKLDEEINEKDVKVKESKKQRGDDDMEKVKRHKKKDSKKRRHSESSEESDEHGRDRRRRSKKKAKGRKQESDSESDSSSSDSESESESDSDDGKKRRIKKATKKRSRSKRSVSSDSEEVESDDSKKLRKSHKKSRPSNRSGSKEVRDRHDEQSRAGRKRHDSDVSEPESEDNKQPRRKKEEAYRGGQKQKRDEEDVEFNHSKDKYSDGSGGRKVARDSDDSETEYENKKKLRSKVEVYSAGMSQKGDDEEAVSKHGKDEYRSDSRGKKVARDSDDSEAEYENRKKLKNESYQRGRRPIREEDEGYNKNGRDRYRSDDTAKRYGTIKEDDRYRGRDIEEGDSDKGDDDRGRYSQRRETVEEDEEDYKRGRDSYRGDREDRFRGDGRLAADKEDKDDDRISREREYSNKGRSRYDDSRTSGKRSTYGDRA
ncbi:hypothetical protein CARUB_v10018778mg [Capsella rubella]|uniref:CWF21 domain-containing protein n=1 Tax=Capsella rubella TaxID=81985 RepID=R0FRX4_9BRAS|nr:hypothetical protein CARUB_v10018778mg [Capsella rubella]